MAFQSGTATDFRDMLSKIAAFSAANGWAILQQSDLALHLKGVGSAGLDEIYVGINATENSANNRYNFESFGSWSYKAGRAFNAMPMTSGGGVFTYLWNNPMPYWLSVTGRRILCFVKVGSVYQCLYLGFINPLATEMQYPYPLLTGGCGGLNTINYSNTAAANNAFWSWGDGDSNGCGKLSMPDGSWLKIASNFGLEVRSPVWAKRELIMPCPDGSYLLYPLYITDQSRPSTLGSIDGIFWLSGYGNSAENTLTIDGKDYIVFPNVFRTTNGSFCAMRKD